MQLKDTELPSVPTISMVDLKSQYLRIKPEIDYAIQSCIDNTHFIKGEEVSIFESRLGSYLKTGSVVSCGNGTDALQLALMAMELRPGDEVIVPAFTYVAAAEVIALLGLVPVLVDVTPDIFTLDPDRLEEALSDRTRAIIPVHLFGQCADMERILQISRKRGIGIIEDNAQSIGAIYKFSNGDTKVAGLLGDMGTTSFFPSKNLGCFGDGGAVYSDSKEWGDKVRMLADHGQVKKYYHDVVGVNSRLDSIQAAVLIEKLKYLDDYIEARQRAARWYTQGLKDIPDVDLPKESDFSTHVYNQYTIKVPAPVRNDLQAFLKKNGVPTMIYYPLPLSRQKAYEGIGRTVGELSVSEGLCKSVLSLPMHTELSEYQLDVVCGAIRQFFQ